MEDLTARVVGTQPPASGMSAGTKLNSLVLNLGGGGAKLKSCNFEKRGAKGVGRYFPGGLPSS